MSIFKNITNTDGHKVDYKIDDGLDKIIDASNLLSMPALIDPHVHFRVPGAEQKEDWHTAAQAAISGGVTTVFDMPNNTPATITIKTLMEKRYIINNQLRDVNIPLRYNLFIGATPDNIKEIQQSFKQETPPVGIKIFMGASTGNLLVDKKTDQEKIFQLAARENLLVAVHAEDEQIIQKYKASFPNPTINDHSKIRHPEAAVAAVERAIELAEKFDTQLYICHVSTKKEINLIASAKNRGLKIYAEVTPHHLFLTEKDYNLLGTKGQMNPPLRSQADQDALWQAINDNIIDTIGTDHAPHTLEEKDKPYPQSPSGVPGIETCLPLLLNAYHQGKISLKKITDLTHNNINKVFSLPETDDMVIVDLKLEKEIKNSNLKTKCGWSPFAGWKLKGWPVYTILKNRIYKIN